jgi:hypothetical protein
VFWKDKGVVYRGRGLPLGMMTTDDHEARKRRSHGRHLISGRSIACLHRLLLICAVCNWMSVTFMEFATCAGLSRCFLLSPA